MDADELLDKLQKAFSDREPDTSDGVKIEFDDGWVHFRKSNTEPIVRVYAESVTEEKAKQLAKNLIDKIK